MNTLTDTQKDEFVRHMNQYEDDSFEQHAQWANTKYGVNLTANDCSKIFMESMFN
jgi:hypothetical protein